MNMETQDVRVYLRNGDTVDLKNIETIYDSEKGVVSFGRHLGETGMMGPVSTHVARFSWENICGWVLLKDSGINISEELYETAKTSYPDTNIERIPSRHPDEHIMG